MFSCVTQAGEFSIARRGGAWYGEFDGEVFGPFDSAAATAQFLATGNGRRLDQSSLPTGAVPADLGAWRRGSRARMCLPPGVGGSAAAVRRSVHP
jgi:hypothetical protein